MKGLELINHAVEWESILKDKWLTLYEGVNAGSSVFRWTLAHGKRKI